MTKEMFDHPFPIDPREHQLADWQADHTIIIGNQALAISELGDIADMRIDQAMQALVDRGYVPAEKGTPWYKVFEPGAIFLAGPDKESGELIAHLWEAFHEAEKRFLSDKTDDNRSKLNDALREYQMARKLTDS